jgi:Flp pilus assembly protein TadD
MNARLWWALVYSSSWLAAEPPKAETGYVDSARCAQCHASIAAAFAKTGMGRSISFSPPAQASFYHRISNRHYTIGPGLSAAPQTGAVTMRRHQLDSEGRETNVLTKSIDLAIGSGNHAITYVHRDAAGRLFELPVGYYRDAGWQMSPGYDRPDHFDFRREVKPECLFCHSRYPSAGVFPDAIDCQRCHGPGATHLAKPQRGTILNPARLAPVRQIEVCLQCHLETASSGIVDSIRRIGRTVYSYRPGEPLADYKLYFTHIRDTFEINHAGYRLLQSRCYLESAGRTTCTTCHDPHSARVKAGACQSCHQSRHTTEHAECASCHMPKRRTEDAVHVVMTDHRILRSLPQADLLAARRENAGAYTGPIRLFYPFGAEEPLYLAAAQVRERNDAEAGAQALERLVGKDSPAPFWFDLAETRRQRGDWKGAEAGYREAIRRDPVEPKYPAALGDLLLRTGRAQEAVRLLNRSAMPAARVTLAIALASLGKLPEGIAILQAVTRSHPEMVSAWINLGVAYEQAPDRAAAEAAYREAIRQQPDSAEARKRLRALLE